MLRYTDFRIDASTLRELPDGSIKVLGQLTHTGVFTYRNHDGSPRREYRPAEEVFREDSMATFAGSTVTIDHPKAPAGQRKVTAGTWKKDAVGHAGDSVRQDGDHLVSDLYIKEAGAVARVRSGELKYVSCGYNVDYDPTPGTTPDGQRFDGIQRRIRGNHIALLPQGVAPRGGTECVLRLDSEGDERTDDSPESLDSPGMTPEQIEALKAQITALTGERDRLRTDAAEVPTLRQSVATLTAELAAARAEASPERLDSLVNERQTVVAAATAAGVAIKGTDEKPLSTLALKKAIIAKRTPALAERVDGYSLETVDAVLASYVSQPHPSMAVLGSTDKPADKPAEKPAEARADKADKVPTISELAAKAHKADVETWKTSRGDLHRGNN